MDIFSIITTALLFSAIQFLVGTWIKTRIEQSISNEYLKVAEILKNNINRSNALISTRTQAYQEINKKLVSLKRYCRAASAEHRNQSEFEPRLESLTEAENISLLSHHEGILRSYEDIELLLSESSINTFKELFSQISTGFNIEIYLISPTNYEDILAGAHEIYDRIEESTKITLKALHADLAFPAETLKPQSLM